MKNNLKYAAIILAAGGSKRLGRPKQLLDWFGKPLISCAIETAIMADLEPVIVVLGAYQREILPVVAKESVRVVSNHNWESGQSSSIKAGINELKKYESLPFFVMLVDQPQIPVELVSKMKEKAEDSKIEIVSTRVNGEICPPTLFKPKCIPELQKLEGDRGGRRIFELYNTSYLDWDDELLLLDADTEEGYAQLVNRYKYAHSQ